jgi:uncharacterized DUF497 family protein
VKKRRDGSLWESLKYGRLLIVCHTFHKENIESAIIRIISNRKPNKIETKEYGEK